MYVKFCCIHRICTFYKCSILILLTFSFSDTAFIDSVIFVRVYFHITYVYCYTFSLLSAIFSGRKWNIRRHGFAAYTFHANNIRIGQWFRRRIHYITLIYYYYGIPAGNGRERDFRSPFLVFFSLPVNDPSALVYEKMCHQDIWTLSSWVISVVLQTRTQGIF